MRSVPIQRTVPQNVKLFHTLKREMDECERLIVYKNNAIFDDVIVKLQNVSRYDEISRSEFKAFTGDNTENECNNVVKPIYLCTRGLNAYLVSAYIATLSKSYVYRKSAMSVLRKFQGTSDKSLDGERHVQIIFIRLKTPRKQFLDYKWSERLMQMVLERQEADHAMSWLSTLGGAFSALGEEFEHCAEMAGKISVKQFELAIRLDNPLLIARCRLYSALSLIQRDYFTTPRRMIRRIYKFALKEKDVRLQNMCQGIWAKLQHSYKQYKQQKKSISLRTLHISV